MLASTSLDVVHSTYESMHDESQIFAKPALHVHELLEAGSFVIFVVQQKLFAFLPDAAN